jgi:hypothetical protein
MRGGTGSRVDSTLSGVLSLEEVIMTRTKSSCVVGAALLVGGLMIAGPAPALAQSNTSFGIWGGVYSPLGKDVDLGGVSGTVQRNNSFAGGARLTFWGSNVLGLSPSTSAVGFHVGAGPAIIRRGKDVSNESNSETNLGVVVGAGIGCHSAMPLVFESTRRTTSTRATSAATTIPEMT